VKFTYKKATRPYFHPGMTAEIFLGETLVGVMGKVSYEICEDLAVEKPVFIIEMDYTLLSEMLSTKIRYTPIPKFAVEKRDLALVVEEKMTCGELTDVIMSSCKYLTEVKLFDVYRSENLGEGKKSMAFNLVFTPSDHEFSADEIEKYVQKILKKLSFMYGINIR
jgi:phenylalanyl-tRNA synthetase beta chain